MKALFVVIVLVGGGLLTGCNTTSNDSAGSAYSARDLAVATEERAQQIYKNGQAANMDEARSKAYADVSAGWVRAHRKAQRNASEAQMTKELTRMGY